MVFASTKTPPILTSEEAKILSAIEGLFIYSAIQKKEISTTSLIEILLSVIEIARPNSAESLLRFTHNVLRRNWAFSKVSTKGKEYAAHEGPIFRKLYQM